MAARDSESMATQIWLVIVALSPLLILYLIPSGDLRSAVVWLWVGLLIAIGALWLLFELLRRAASRGH